MPKQGVKPIDLVKQAIQETKSTDTGTVCLHLEEVMLSRMGGRCRNFSTIHTRLERIGIDSFSQVEELIGRCRM